MTPKEKASIIFFEHWFSNYSKLHQMAYADAIKQIDKMIALETDEIEIDFLWQVREKLSLFKG